MCCLFQQDRNIGVLSRVRSCDGCQINCALYLLLRFSVTKDHNSLHWWSRWWVWCVFRDWGGRSVGLWWVTFICSNNRCSVTEAVCENPLWWELEKSKYDCCVSVGHDSVFTLHHKLLYIQDNSYYTELFRSSDSFVSMATLIMSKWILGRFCCWHLFTAFIHEYIAMVMVTLLLKRHMKQKYL